jgi:glutaconate CoA-transferase subunit A
MADKVKTLAEAVAPIPDGTTIALGGNTFHRSPSAVVHELVRQGKERLRVVKTAGAYDVDLLAGAGCIDRAAVGYVGFEAVFGMAPKYRSAVEEGRLVVEEHACYTVATALRASVQGVPFLPVAGMFGSDLLPARDWKTVKDPYTGEELLAIQSLRPEWTILHVEKADSEGNAFVSGSIFEDLLMANAASRVLVTAEEVVSTESFRRDGFRATFPGFLVETVVHAPRGAWPCSCGELYPVDEAYFKAYLEASGDEIAYRDFLRQHIFEEAKVAEEGSS